MFATPVHVQSRLLAGEQSSDGAVPLVSFVIPVRNDAGRLARCMESIRGNEYPTERLEVIVVDNGSEDHSAAIARAFGAHVICHAQGHVGELRNLGALAAHGEVLAFVDSDHELDAGWIRTAVAALSPPGVGGAGDLCHSPSDGTWVQHTYDGCRNHKATRCDVEWLGGGNLVVSREAFDVIGGFDTTLETCEDVDFCRRLRRRGYRLVRDRGLRSVHLGDPATLAALFRGELWRGRDNISVSLAPGVSWRDLPSVAIPAIDLACFALIIAGLASLAVSGLMTALLAASAVLVLALTRAIRLVRNTRRYGVIELGRALLVALVYDTARALALVLRRRHHRAGRILEGRRYG